MTLRYILGGSPVSIGMLISFAIVSARVSSSTSALMCAKRHLYGLVLVFSLRIFAVSLSSFVVMIVGVSSTLVGRLS